MTRIFAIVTLGVALLAGGGAISVAYQESSADSAQMDGIAELFASGVEISTILPFVMMVGLVIATLGVLARS
ncbi:hypothetical protein [Natrinema sp. CGMCC1.2065]|uniref:hypothetical protein n=1 Tax=Natrinema sp. CGMCC1.2065 TaxID=3445767 RepID=UPI003F4A25A6